MAFIGESSITGMASNVRTNTSDQLITMYSPLLYIAGSNQEVFQASYYCGNSTGTASGVDVAVYDVTSGFSGASLVGYVNTGQLLANQWNTVTFATPLALTSGNTYAVARSIRSSTNVSEHRVLDGNTRTYVGTSTGASAPPSTWAGTTADFYRYAFYAETRTASSGLTATISWLRI